MFDFSDLWDYVVDGFDYLIHFEWLSDLRDGIGETFENLGEFSSYGLIFGVIGVAFLLFTKKYMLDSFTKLMKPGTAIFITIATFAATFIVCYLIGKRYQDTA